MLNRILFAFALFLVGTIAVAQNGVINPQTDQSQLTRNKGQLPGTTTDDAATAGNVGEFVSAFNCCFGGGAVSVTITIASPAVITQTGHNITGVVALVFATSGALPTGLTAGTTYYTLAATVPGNTYSVATSIPNALAGTAVNTSGTQSGAQTASDGISVTTNTPVDLGAISLTAGDWDAWINCGIVAASTTTSTTTECMISPTSATRNTAMRGIAVPFTGAGSPAMIAGGPFRISIASTTTYFAVLRPLFGVSTMTAADGFLSARRRR